MTEFSCIVAEIHTTITTERPPKKEFMRIAVLKNIPELEDFPRKKFYRTYVAWNGLSVKEGDPLTEEVKQFPVVYDNKSATKIIARQKNSD